MSSRRDRQREIAEVLSRQGLGYLASVVGLDRWLRGPARGAAPTRPEHLRLALEQLGPTFIKLGQVLSTRRDLLSPEYQAELAKLQDAAPPVPADVVRDLVAQELGSDAEDAFATFDFEPVAAASIGQAHAATLHDGTDVIVKVRRPGVVELVEQDLEILQELAVRATRRWQAAADYDVAGLAEEFARTLRSELDYVREGRSAGRFAENFAADPGVQIPRVFWETTTSRVITLERVEGIKVNDLEALDAAGIDRRALAERATRVTADMIFEHGFFHADPHPGNFFIGPGGRIAIIDFGMVGEVDDRLRDQLATLLVGLMREDSDAIAGVLLALGVAHGAVDRARLRDDLARLLERFSGRPLGEISLAAAIDDVTSIMRNHRLRVPRDLALLLKVAIMDEGMATELDPGFHIGDTLAPYAQQLMLRQLSPAALARRLGAASIEAVSAGAELPQQIRRLLATIGDGGVEVRLRADDVEAMLARAERMSNRLVAGVLAAAFIDGVAGLMAVHPERWRGREGPLIAFGFGAAGTLAAYAAWNAGRSRAPTRRRVSRAAPQPAP